MLPSGGSEPSKICPICHKREVPIAAEDYCELCGMKIADLGAAPKVQKPEGEFAFCCEHCKELFQKFEKRGEENGKRSDM